MRASSRATTAGICATAVVVASAATTAVAAAGHAAGVSLTVNGAAVPVGGFGVLTAVFSLAGAVLAVALARFARHPRRTFLRTTVALTALSVLPDLLATAAPGTKALLMSTHLIAAAIVIPALASRLPDAGRFRQPEAAGTAAR
jgi:hypothetical protein